MAGNLSKNRLAYNRVRAADQLRESLTAERREDLSFLWEAVKRLPVKYREVIHLFYYEGFSVEELSELPFPVTEVTYTAYGEALAEIRYIGGADAAAWAELLDCLA